MRQWCRIGQGVLRHCSLFLRFNPGVDIIPLKAPRSSDFETWQRTSIDQAINDLDINVEIVGYLTNRQRAFHNFLRN